MTDRIVDCHDHEKYLVPECRCFWHLRVYSQCKAFNHVLLKASSHRLAHDAPLLGYNLLRSILINIQV